LNSAACTPLKQSKIVITSIETSVALDSSSEKSQAIDAFLIKSNFAS
jgi:hypothetical protein